MLSQNNFNRNNLNRNNNRSLHSSLFLCLSAGVCHGASIDYSLYSTLEYSDNIRQVAAVTVPDEDPDSGRILNAGINFSWENEATSTLAANIAGTFGRESYSVDDLEDEDRKDLTASLLFQPSSNNFRLSLFESIQQVRADRTSILTVGNTRDVNVFSVIPSYYIAISNASRIEMKYSHSEIDDSLDLNSRTVDEATVGFRRLISERTSWSLNAAQADIEFDDTEEEFERQSVFFRFMGEGGLTDYTIDYGVQEIVDIEGTDQTLIGLSLLRMINTYSQMTLRYQKGYGDPVNLDVSNSILQSGANDQAAFIQGIVVEEQVGFSYSYQKREFDVGVDIFGRALESEDDIVDNPLIDEKRYGITLASGYRFSIGNNQPLNFGLRLSYQYERDEFNITELDNKISTAALRLSYFPSQKLDINFEVSSRNTSGEGIQADTDENRALIGFVFYPRDKR